MKSKSIKQEITINISLDYKGMLKQCREAKKGLDRLIKYLESEMKKDKRK